MPSGSWSTAPCAAAPWFDSNAVVRSARLDFADPEHPVSLVEVGEPSLPRGDWARVRVTAGGICGSDLHAIFPDGSGTPTFLPLVGFPMEMGHELGGVIAERRGLTAPFWFAFVGSGLTLAAVWRRLAAIAHVGEPTA